MKPIKSEISELFKFQDGIRLDIPLLGVFDQPPETSQQRCLINRFFRFSSFSKTSVYRYLNEETKKFQSVIKALLILFVGLGGKTPIEIYINLPIS